MERVRTLSQARAELFALFEEVTAHAGRKVILRHRGSDRDAVLVSRQYLHLLEQARPGAATASFSLFGSAVLDGDLEQALADIRAGAAAAFDDKVERIGRQGTSTAKRSAAGGTRVPARSRRAAGRREQR